MNQELSDILTGKNTIEATQALSEAFLSRFGCEYGSASEIALKLLPGGKASTWATLDKNINVFCKQFYDYYETNQEKINFFDEVRFVIQSLPQRQDYKLSFELLDFSDPKKALEYFTSCSHCWRTVFKKPLQKVKPLCHLHDLPSTHKEYRKRQYLKKHQQVIKYNLLKSLVPLIHVKHKFNIELNDYVKKICLKEDGPLLYISKYLHALRKTNNISLLTEKDILLALEYPTFTSRQKTKRKIFPLWYEAWEHYITDHSNNFRLNYLKIIEAESWLRAEAEHAHGGKRR